MIVAAANPALDRLLEVERLVVGGIHQPPGAREVAGGKALNVARSAHALGAEVLAVVLLGGNTGLRVAALLQADGVRCEAIPTGGETRQTLAVLARDTGELTQFYELGDDAAADGFAAFNERVIEHCGPGRWLVLSGSLPAGIDPSVAGEMVERAAARGSAVAVDQHGPWLAASVAARPGLVKVNDEEARELTGAAPQDAVRELCGRTGARVVVTLGTRGALMGDGDALWHGRIDARGVYSTGCGDTFLGAMVASLEAVPGRWRDAFAAGIAAATANAECPGPGVLDPLRARALIRRVRLTRL